MKTTKKVSQKTKKDDELEILEKAIEAERNFQKACEMADGFPPPKSGRGFPISREMAFL